MGQFSAFGEIMLRLSPPNRELLLQTPRPDVCTAGAEANHRLSARIDARDGHAQTNEIELSGIVDRVGAGDAFAAGVLHALRLGQGIERAAADGLTLTCLKHSLPGDASLFGRTELDSFVAGGVDVRR